MGEVAGSTQPPGNVCPTCRAAAGAWCMRAGADRPADGFVHKDRSLLVEHPPDPVTGSVHLPPAP
ncbi:MAG: hypothetical protein LC624_01785 [Halobacteriales archaeon]|nr:hypothetical protein [Halobacteriales archaeon]